MSISYLDVYTISYRVKQQQCLTETQKKVNERINLPEIWMVCEYVCTA